MCHYAALFGGRAMIVVYCFSGTGRSRVVADRLAAELGAEVTAAEKARPEEDSQADVAVAVFPVYCQNIPKQMKRLLTCLGTKKVAVVATYGKISPGNTLWEATRRIERNGGRVIAAQAVPIGHTFLSEEADPPSEMIRCVIDEIRRGETVHPKRGRKHPLADLFPALRSRLGVSLRRSATCTRCGRCTQVCPMGAMKASRPDHRCVRCLRCVTVCPQHALTAVPRGMLRRYLKRYRSRSKS